MNNEDKRFKQINRIATPIKVNQEGEKIEEVRTPEVQPKKQLKQKTTITFNTEAIVKTLIVIFVIGIIGLSAYLLIPESIKGNKIPYNDITTITTYPSLDFYSLTSTKVSDSPYIMEDIEYQIGNFTLRKSNNIIYINNLKVAEGENVSSTLGTVDDLLMFTASSGVRTNTLYIVDKNTNIIKEYYHIGDINGMVIENESDAVNYNSESILIKASNVINDTIVPNNTKGNIKQVSLCDENALFESSIEINKPVVVYYSIMYKGNHEFSDPLSVYEETMEEYKNKHNYCK